MREAIWLQNGLLSLFEQQRLCDVTIQVQKEAFPCHRVVLSAVSGYFDAMFSSGMKEAKMEVVNISDISSETFQDVLSFIYRSDSVITVENVEDMLHAACIFQIIPLKEKCEEFLLDELSSENCVGFWVTGKAFSCERLADLSLRHILKNFDEICTKDEILKLEIDDFLQIMKHEDLVCHNEETVCNTALNWLKCGENERKEFTFAILQEMRLCLVSLEFILDKLYTARNIQTDEKCTKVLQSAIKYHAMPESRHMSESLDVRLRNSSSQAHFTLVLGKRQGNLRDEFATDFLGYSEREKNWYSLCPAPQKLGEEFAVCALGNDIFVSGGSNKPESFFQFSTKLCKWIEKPCLKQGRYRHCMIAVKNSIYVLGGYNFGTVGSVEEYDLLTNTWSVAGELKQAVDAASVTVYGDKIFIFGGWQGFSGECSSVQCFDTVTNTCSVVGNLPSPQKDTRAVAYDNKTFVVCTNGDIFCFQPGQKITCVHTIKNFYKRIFGVLRDGKSLCVLGGEFLSTSEMESESEEKVSADIVHVNEQGASDTGLPSVLPVPMEVYGCYRTVIKLKYPLVPFSEQVEFM